jgi:hypothetical protein
MRNLKSIGQLLAFLSGLLFFVGCQQDEQVLPQSIDERGSALVGSSPNLGFYTLGPNNELYFYTSGPPVTLFSTSMITGLRDSGELILSIDIQPRTGFIFGVSNMDRIYWIRTDASTNPHNPTTQAFLVSQEPFKPGMEGTTVGMDFDGTTDKINIVTDEGQSLIIDPNSGQVVQATTVGVHGGTVKLNGSAIYSSPYTTVGSTTYHMDAYEGKLYKQTAGQDNLTLIGSTGLTIAGDGGFDISRKGTALAVMYTGKPGAVDPTQGQAYRLYNVNLKSAQVTLLGVIDTPTIGMAIQ